MNILMMVVVSKEIATMRMSTQVMILLEYIRVGHPIHKLHFP